MVSRIGLTATAALFGTATAAWAANAARVVDHDPGDFTGITWNGAPPTGYTDVSTALGETSRDTGYGWGANPPLFLSNPYNNPWRPQDFVALGRGGSITLELENFAVALDGAPELNVLVFQQVLAGSGQPWYDRRASVSVSENGSDWVALTGGTAIDFDTPATGYVFPGEIPRDNTGGYGAINAADLDDYTESDYGLPMPGELDFSTSSSFEASRAAAYGLSGGGNWLDFSDTGLARVGYIRFDVPSDVTQYFALDAVYLNHDAVGAAIPEPTTLAAIVAVGLAAHRRRRA